MTDSRKTVFMTGATGNMGREALREIARRSNDIRLRILVRPQEAKHKVVRRVQRERLAEIVWGDLVDAESIERGVAGADIVLHMGGLVSPLADNLPPETVTAVNVGGAQNIVNAIHKVADPARTRLAYVGTVAQTGSRNAPIHWGRCGDPIKISHYDHYAVTKTRAEAIVAESGITHWVSLRQSGMAHYAMHKIFDPIIFHNPLNGVFEWSTAHDSGRLMAALCGDDVPEELWRGFYNIGGGAASRVVNHEFMELATPGFQSLFQPHWFATRNFHGQWYADSDHLEQLVPYREQSLGDFVAEAVNHKSWIERTVPRVLPGVVKKRLEGLARSPGGSLYWMENNDVARIEAFFGSHEAWRAIPREWEAFELATHDATPIHLEHGYDETRRPADWRTVDLLEAGAFRGLKREDTDWDGPYARIGWTCAVGHRFEMSPNLMLRGGHGCPTCMLAPEHYAARAEHNAFFAQVWDKDA